MEGALYSEEELNVDLAGFGVPRWHRCSCCTEATRDKIRNTRSKDKRYHYRTKEWKKPRNGFYQR